VVLLVQALGAVLAFGMALRKGGPPPEATRPPSPRDTDETTKRDEQVLVLQTRAQA
jgi:hypothetical protein